MSTVIKLKRSTSSGSVPTTSDLQDGEVALNVTDKKMFVRNGGTIVTVANFSSGGRGLLYAVIYAQYTFNKYAGLWSLEQQSKQ